MALIINPFAQIAKQHFEGMIYVVNYFAGSSSSSSSSSSSDSSSSSSGPTPKPVVLTVDSLVQATITYIKTIYTLDAEQQSLLYIAITDGINGYVNAKTGGYLNYSNAQQKFIFQFVEGLQNVQSSGFDNYFDSVSNAITQSGLTTSEQSPLLLGVAIGKANYAFWDTVVGEGGDILSLIGKNHALSSPRDLPFWVGAAEEAALIVARRNSKTVGATTNESLGVDPISALASSIAVGVGVYAFNWVQLNA